MDQTLEHAPAVLAPSPHAQWLTPVLFALADVVAAASAMLLAIYLREAIFPGLFGLEPFSPIRNYASLWPVLGLLLIMRILFGLYPGYGVNPAEELRRQTIATTLVAFFVLAGGALFQFSADYSRLVIVQTFVFLLFWLPATRSLCKSILSGCSFYGEGVWVVSNSERGGDISRMIRATPTLGLRVVGQSASEPPKSVSCPHCLLVPDQVMNISQVLDTLNGRFRHVWLVPNLLDISSVWVTPRDLQGHLALELRNNLLEPGNRLLKRISDALFVLLLAPFALLLFLFLSIIIRLDSSGPVLFQQVRIGRNGRPFKILKFRTMYADGPKRLEKCLTDSPEARVEWERTRKIMRDPRVTRVGQVLRRLSLDELPQIWNILRGDMSLVGPRAITRTELGLYGDKAHLYTSVLPGLTGLWQVSGRSRLGYEQRVRLDAYYVRNWSLWLDLVVIGQTASAVLKADGAY